MHKFITHNQNTLENMDKFFIYLGSLIDCLMKRFQTITFELQQWTNGVNPIVDLSITGTGTFKLYRGTSTTPIQTFTLNNSSIDIQLSGIDEPLVTIKGNVHKITALNIWSTFWRPYVGGLLSIDLRNAIGLKKLSLPWSSIVTLDLTHCMHLENIFLDNSQKLETVDVSHNKNLVEFSYSQTSMYSQTDILKALVLNNKKLNKLLLTNQHGLTSLDLSDCPNLLMLNILDTDLPGLDISHNLNLNQISCSFSQTAMDNFYLDLLANVETNPIIGDLYSRPCPAAADAVAARDTLVATYSWTINCN